MTTAWLPSCIAAAGSSLNCSASSGARVAMRVHARSAFLRMCPHTVAPSPFFCSMLPSASRSTSGARSRAMPGLQMLASAVSALMRTQWSRKAWRSLRRELVTIMSVSCVSSTSNTSAR